MRCWCAGALFDSLLATGDKEQRARVGRLYGGRGRLFVRGRRCSARHAAAVCYPPCCRIVCLSPFACAHLPARWVGPQPDDVFVARRPCMPTAGFAPTPNGHMRCRAAYARPRRATTLRRTPPTRPRRAGAAAGGRRFIEATVRIPAPPQADAGMAAGRRAQCPPRRATQCQGVLFTKALVRTLRPLRSGRGHAP